jgi:NADH-quinone oxidoreductase subunit B/C/D
MAVTEETLAYRHPLYDVMLSAKGLSVGLTSVDDLLTWGLKNSLWIFPMATSCCGIELMAAAAARVDLDRMGTIVRASPRQADVMVVAGTITVKMAPRVRRLWDQMPEPKWCIAMGSCAISGDFYRNLYPVVPGIDTFLPVDVYVPGCPPNPEALMQGLLRLQEKIELQRTGKVAPAEPRPDPAGAVHPRLGRVDDGDRSADLTERQTRAAQQMERDPEPGEDYSPRVELDRPAVPATSSLEEDFAAILRERFGIAVVPVDAPALIPGDRHLELAGLLQSLGYRQLIHITALHRPGREGASDTYEVIYALRKIGAASQIASWRVVTAAMEPVPSLVPIFAGADWQEREQYDLVGVRFSGHPDLRRIMLPESWTGHPLRRDFPAAQECAPWR